MPSIPVVQLRLVLDYVRRCNFKFCVRSYRSAVQLRLQNRPVPHIFLTIDYSDSFWGERNPKTWVEYIEIRIAGQQNHFRTLKWLCAGKVCGAFFSVRLCVASSQVFVFSSEKGFVGGFENMRRFEQGVRKSVRVVS